MDSVEAMNTLIQERHNQRDNFISIEVSRETEVFKFYLAIEKSGFAIFQ